LESPTQDEIPTAAAATIIMEHRPVGTQSLGVIAARLFFGLIIRLVRPSLAAAALVSIASNAAELPSLGQNCGGPGLPPCSVPVHGPPEPHAARGPCLLYGAGDVAGGAQLFTSSLFDGSAATIGPKIEHVTVQALAFNPRDRGPFRLFALANQQGAPSAAPPVGPMPTPVTIPPPVDVYTVDLTSGALRPVGATGFRSTHGLAFRERDTTLWTWDEQEGLVEINIETGRGRLVFGKRGLRFDALAWNPEGTLLYGSIGAALWIYDLAREALQTETQPLPQGSNIFLVRPDGHLLLAKAVNPVPPDTMPLFIFDIGGKQLVNSFRINQPFGTMAAPLHALAWPNACGNPDLGGRTHLITAVKVDKKTLCEGDEAMITVETQHPDGLPNTVDVFVNHRAGAVQYLQFTGPPGTRRVAVQAGTPERYADFAEINIELVACAQIVRRPHVWMGPNPFHPDHVDFVVTNHNDFERRITPLGVRIFPTAYVWEFGDGQTATTTEPFVTHDYSGSAHHGDRYRNFVLQVGVQQPPGPLGAILATGHKSLSLYDFYEFHRGMGVIQPPTLAGDPQRVDHLPDGSGAGYVGAYTVTNVDDVPFTLTASRLERQYCDANQPSLQFNSSIDEGVFPGQRFQGVQILGTVADIGPAPDRPSVCSVSLHLAGTDSLGRQVAADIYYQIRDNPFMRVPVTNPQTIKALNSIDSRRRAPNYSPITDEDLYRSSIAGTITAPSGPASNPIRLAAGSASCEAPPSCGTPPVLGARCDPSCSPATATLVCAVAGTENDWCQDPPHIQNAQKGDAVMSPGCGTIGGLLHSIGQHFSHVGIMTGDGYELVNSTANEDLLYEDKAHDGPGPGPWGIKPDVLRFAWPGAIQQTVEEAFITGSNLPNFLLGKTYNERPLGPGFDPVKCADDTDLVYPRVARGTAVNRDTLHKVADTAKRAIGNFHYRFFGYTRGDASETNNFSPASGTPPDDPLLASMLWGGISVAQRPSVCSSFIWQMFRDTGVPIDFREDALAGSVVPSSTAGLALYSEAQRDIAGNALWDSMYNNVKAKGLLAQIFEAPDRYANQAVNCFAFDNCEHGGSGGGRVWTGSNSGQGVAVSPDDMLHWNMYPRSEPIVFRMGKFSRPYTWQAAAGTGCIAGSVQASDRLTPAPAPGADVMIPGLQTSEGETVSTQTDAQGNFSFQAVPALSTGGYCIDAQMFTSVTPTNNGCFNQGQTCQVKVAPGNVCTIVTVALRPPPQIFRTVTVNGTIHVDNKGTNSDHNQDQINITCHVNQADPQVAVDSKLQDAPPSNQSITSDGHYGGYEAATCTLNTDNSVRVHLDSVLQGCDNGIFACGWQVVQERTDDLLVPPGQTSAFQTHLQNSNNDVWADFDLKILNSCDDCFGNPTCP
jgi:hypothetical protein